MRIYSDEKRLEVAASLRESREFISGLPKTSLEQNAFDTFERILACVDYEQGNIFDYLADLIDRPTCKMIYDKSSCRTTCTNCATSFELAEFDYADANVFEGYSYCPKCGAEVVE